MAERRRAKVRISEDALRDILDLVDEVDIRGVEISQDPIAVYVLLSGQGLPPIPADADSPIFPYISSRKEKPRG